MVKIITVLNISTVFRNIIVWMKLHAKYPTGPKDFQSNGKLTQTKMENKSSQNRRFKEMEKLTKLEKIVETLRWNIQTKYI